MIAPASMALTKEPNDGILGEDARVFVVLAGEELFLRGLPALEDDKEEGAVPAPGVPHRRGHR